MSCVDAAAPSLFSFFHLKQHLKQDILKFPISRYQILKFQSPRGATRNECSKFHCYLLRQMFKISMYTHMYRYTCHLFYNHHHQMPSILEISSNKIIRVHQQNLGDICKYLLGFSTMDFLVFNGVELSL